VTGNLTCICIIFIVVIINISLFHKINLSLNEAGATAWCMTEVCWYVPQLFGSCEPPLPALPAQPSSDDYRSKCDTAAHISSQYSSSDDEGDDTDSIPPLVSMTRTPQVLWHQDECTIYVKVMIAGVQKYCVGWDAMHLQFRYGHSGKIRIVHKILIVKPQEKDHLGDLDIDDKILLTF
jgi:hypothetical protein